jgi:DNA gyrase subunit B
MLDKLKFDISGDDFREGLTAIISVRLLNLNLKDKLKLNLEIEYLCKSGGKWNDKLSGRKSNDAESLFKIILAAQARHAAKKRVKWSNVKP